MRFLMKSLLQNNPLLSAHSNLNRLAESTKILQVRYYAARKGTREKKKKAKVKVEVQKVGFIPHNQRDKSKSLLHRESRKFDDSWKKDPIDNVYVAKYFKWVVYPFSEAVQCHRETHHPEVYNKPNANLHVSIELNMQGEKKTRFVDNFTRLVAIPHKFDHGEERTIIAFSKNIESQKQAEEAGAQLSGGVDLIKQIQNGQVSLLDFKFIVAHPEILPELVSLRGLMKRRFPSPKAGTLDINLGQVVQRFVSGINYSAVQDEHEKDFGIIQTVIGTLNMDPNQLEDNFAALITDVHRMKPKREGPFITRSLLWSPPSPEKLKVDHNLYISTVDSLNEAAEEDEEVAEKITL